MIRAFASDIGRLQNHAPQLNRFAAGAWIYSRAKLILTLQFTLTVPAALLSSVFVASLPHLKVWAVFYALTVGILDVVVLDRVQKNLKKKAARVQEELDCELFRLPWNSLVAGPRVDGEDIAVAAAKYARSPKRFARLKDWYPPAVDRVALAYARLICQRANCWWDSSLRKRVAHVLTALPAIEILVVLVVALASGNILVRDLIIAFYAPIAPAVIWTVRERYRQLDAAGALDSLRSHVEAVLSEAQTGDCNEAALAAKSRCIQDQIFGLRAANPLIFDWVNALIRGGQQQTMNERALQWVAELERARLTGA